jgi:DNA polymerase delta subunit 1
MDPVVNMQQNTVLHLTDHQVKYPISWLCPEWCRPVPPPNYEPEELNLQLIDMDYVTFKKPGDMMPYSVIRMHAVTTEGYYFLVHVHGFRPYFYVALPDAVDDVNLLKSSLNTALLNSPQFQSQLRLFPKVKIHGPVCDVTDESGNVKNIMHYDSKLPHVYKIVVASPNLVTMLRNILTQKRTSGGFTLNGKKYQYLQTFDSNLLYVVRFMVDTDIVGMSWFTIPYQSSNVKENVITVDDYKKIIARHPMSEDPRWSLLAPLRILSFDIECCSLSGRFPVATADPVIQISFVLKIHGLSGDDCVMRLVLCLNETTPISNYPNARVAWVNKEENLLQAWRNIVNLVDPDLITGYNINNFDIPYLLDRAGKLGIGIHANTFGRIIPRAQCTAKSKVFQSNQAGSRDVKEIRIPGRVVFDMMIIMVRDHKFRSFSLDAVSREILGHTKEDVHHTEIPLLFKKDATSRGRLASYCLKDSQLPLDIMDRMMKLSNYVEMARVAGVPLSYLLEKGQGVKVLSLMCRAAKARTPRFVIPNNQDPIYMDQYPIHTDTKYEGATVLKPKKGFYQIPTATLDYASLYPSIMMAHNLCYSTLVPKQQVASMDPNHVTITPSGDCFVKASLQPGFLPAILNNLLAARKRAKNDMKKISQDTDPFLYAVLDGRQLALKLSANSVYGFTGASTGKLYCVSIAASVTSFGRVMIEATRDFILKHYTKKNGFKHDADVVYGDTDSVMVIFGNESLQECMDMGKEAAGLISQQFLPPIKLEFEKCYFPYLLMAKKRYAAMYWTNANKPDKMDCKGIETVRRDTCRLVGMVIQRCLNHILIDKSPQKAKEFVHQIISDLNMQRIDLYYLIVSKTIAKPLESYTANAAHIKLAQRMNAKGTGCQYKTGDRIAYAVIQGAKNSKVCENVREPREILEEQLPVDADYYLRKQLEIPLTKIFDAIFDDPKKELFTGSHMMSKVITGARSGPMGKFVTVVKTCEGCRCALKVKNGDDLQKGICKSCIDLGKEDAIVANRLKELVDIEDLHEKYWSECRTCQGEQFGKVTCGAVDCHNFYRRTDASIKKRKCESKLNEMGLFPNKK